MNPPLSLYREVYCTAVIRWLRRSHREVHPDNPSAAVTAIVFESANEGTGYYRFRIDFAAKVSRRKVEHRAVPELPAGNAEDKEDCIT